MFEIISFSLVLLAFVNAGDTNKKVAVVGRNGESGYSVEVSISTVFPTITITPANDSEGFCRYTLMGVFESEANEGFYDPRTDYDIANSRVALDSIDWRIEKGERGVVSVVGVPRGRKRQEEEEEFAFDEDEGDIIEVSPNENEKDEGERTPFSRFRLALTANEGANGAQMGVTVEDYDYYRDTAGTVLVLEWGVDAGYAIGAENVTRDRRSIAAGGCGYDAGPDADDGTEQPVRCEVRYEVSEEGEGAVTVYQSYVHFSSLSLNQPNVSLSARPRVPEQKSFSAQPAPFGLLGYVTTATATLTALLAILAMHF